MPANIQFTTSFDQKTDCFIVPLVDKDTKSVKDLLPPPVFKHLISLMESKDSGFEGKHGDITCFSYDSEYGFKWYGFVGLDKDASMLKIEKAGGALFTKLSALKIAQANVLRVLNDTQSAHLANGLYLKSYSFKKYKTKDKDKAKKDPAITIQCIKKSEADKIFKRLKAVSDAVMTARDYVSEPPNVLYPESYAQQIKSFMKGTSVKVTVIDDKKLEKMGAGALLAVGKGSERKPRLVILDYDGRTKKSKSDRPLALVGKGVTFDTGGYSLKPRDAMETMKMDMGGSAAVICAIKALADNAEPVHVVAAVALAENMVDGGAYRVDDILTSLSGQTIEVLNTDAEGRLCLADALTYIQKTYDPKSIVDVATLTGACMGALGLEMAGVFSNSKDMQTKFWDSGEVTGDAFWPLPINKDFDKLIDSTIADMRNLATSPYGGASTAAVFLQRFITEDRPWAHLDIAGTAWRKDDTDTCPKGATGFGVRALYHWVTTQH